MMVKHKSDVELTMDTPYLLFMGELQDDYVVYFGANWLYYNEITLHVYLSSWFL